MGTKEEIKNAIFEEAFTDDTWLTINGIYDRLKDLKGGDGLPLLGSNDYDKLRRIVDNLVHKKDLEFRYREDSDEKEYQIHIEPVSLGL